MAQGDMLLASWIFPLLRWKHTSQVICGPQKSHFYDKLRCKMAFTKHGSVIYRFTGWIISVYTKKSVLETSMQYNTAIRQLTTSIWMTVK